jgi:thioredoxin-dependent peroxiredoxin
MVRVTSHVLWACLVGKNHLGFGIAQLALYVQCSTDGVVEKWWQEPGINNDGTDEDPYGETTPEKYG